MVRPRRNPGIITPFISYSTAQVAAWCHVSMATAYRYKNGTQAPPRPALTLFRLHADGRILGSEWDGWSIRGGTLYDPCNRPLTVSVLHHFQLFYQIAVESIHRDRLPVDLDVRRA